MVLRNGEKELQTRIQQHTVDCRVPPRTRTIKSVEVLIDVRKVVHCIHRHIIRGIVAVVNCSVCHFGGARAIVTTP